MGILPLDDEELLDEEELLDDEELLEDADGSFLINGFPKNLLPIAPSSSASISPQPLAVKSRGSFTLHLDVC